MPRFVGVTAHKTPEVRIVRILEAVQSICDESIDMIHEHYKVPEQPAQPPRRIPTPAEDTLVTRGQADEYLGLSPDTLAVWATTGRYNLPYVKIGRRAMYRKSDLDAFIEQRVRVHT